MSEKTHNIVRLVLGGLIALIFIASAVNKLIGSAEAVAMAANFGIDAATFRMLGIIEIIAALLFLYPRTGVLGTLLLVAYIGGAIATHLEHGDSYIAQVVISALLWLVAIYRFPELTTRIMGK